MYKSGWRTFLILSITMLTLLSASFLGWQYARQSSIDFIEKKFESESGHLFQQIRVRFNAYEQVLRGGVGFLSGSDQVTREGWRSYVDHLAVADYFPGILGIGFSEWIGGVDALAEHSRRLRNEGFPDYEVRPTDKRQEYTSVIYLEPFTERNSRAFGYDMYSEATRRKAMERARDTGNAALSGKVELVQEITIDKQAGFLLYLPVYENGNRPKTVQARRSELTGFVYSAFRANDLMYGILERDLSNIVFQIYDESPSRPNSLLYDGNVELGLDSSDNPAKFTTTRQVSIAGQQWTIRFSSTPSFEQVHDSASATAVLSTGILLSLLITTIAWMLMLARSRVTRRTAELHKIEHVNAQLKEATRVAQSANLAKSSFLAAMSHEIRTPMNGVVGMVEVLLNESPNAQQTSSLNIVLDSAFSLLAIIDDILDFSKIEAGYMELEKTDELLSAIVEGVVSNMVPQAIKNNVLISLFIDPDVPDAVSVDALRLRQILTNLIGNAVKFSGTRIDRIGRVQVRVVQNAVDPLYVRFDIIDNGVGIEPSVISSIFESFVQAESSTTRRFGGSGLGLAISKRLIDIMEGEIEVRSEPGEGSVFSITLPLQPTDSMALAPYEDISNVKCLIWPGVNYSAEDMKVYLKAAGVNAHIEPDVDELLLTIDNGNEPIVLLCEDSVECLSNKYISDAHPSPTTSPDVRRVILSRDHGRHVVNGAAVRVLTDLTEQSDSPLISTITIQLDGLRCRDLMEAVAIAAGRASSEIMHTLVEEPVMDSAMLLNMHDSLATRPLILVAEDDHTNQKVLDKQLTLLGFTADFANDGEQALTMWRSKRYGMLFTDLHMPRMDGYELTNTIRREEPYGERASIVALTANALSCGVRRAQNAGVDEYLTKPIKLNSLKQTIERHLGLSTSENNDLDPLATDQQQKTIHHECTFDQNVLVSLLGDDQDAISDCLKQYLHSLNDQGERLALAVRENDKLIARRLSHQLTSSSLSIGTLDLSTTCRALERACNDGSYILSEHDIHSLDKALEQAKEAITQALNAA